MPVVRKLWRPHLPRRSFPPAVAARTVTCLLEYPAIFSAEELPRGDLEGNSNWALNCLVSHCKIAITWKDHGAPIEYDNPPCKTKVYDMGVGATAGPPTCVKYHKCP